MCSVGTSVLLLAVGFVAPQGKLDEAGQLHRRSLEILERGLGPDHPSVATSLNNLAGLLKAQVRAIRQFQICSCSARLMWCAVVSSRAELFGVV